MISEKGECYSKVVKDDNGCMFSWYGGESLQNVYLLWIY